MMFSGNFLLFYYILRYSIFPLFLYGKFARTDAWIYSSQINKRGETVDEKIKKLDAELGRYKEQIKRIRPGPAQEAVKARAMRVLKQKRM